MRSGFAVRAKLELPNEIPETEIRRYNWAKFQYSSMIIKLFSLQKEKKISLSPLSVLWRVAAVWALLVL